jgi:hypothetical protein
MIGNDLRLDGGCFRFGCLASLAKTLWTVAKDRKELSTSESPPCNFNNHLFNVSPFSVDILMLGFLKIELPFGSKL